METGTQPKTIVAISVSPTIGHKSFFAVENFQSGSQVKIILKPAREAVTELIPEKMLDLASFFTRYTAFRRYPTRQ